MCGIFGYIGDKNAVSLGLEGIRELEYRGYDSAGAAFFVDGKLQTVKAVGKIKNLEEKIFNKNQCSPVALYHSRWATHGGVTESNAHPHVDCRGEIAVVHNGIIENYQDLKRELEQKGHTFRSETDTEVLPHLIEEELRVSACSFEEGVLRALQKIRGTYGIGVMYAGYPSTLIAARNFSPLLLGLGTGEYFIASDASAVLRHTRDVLYLHDGDMAVVTPAGYKILDLQHRLLERTSQVLDWTPEQAQKGNFQNFMQKEIFEQPAALENSIRGRLIPEEGNAKLGGLLNGLEELRRAKRIVISACGTAYLAGKVGKYMIEEYAGLPVEIEAASEFRYRKPIFQEGDVFFAISQSGETADTLAALREAKEKGVPVFGIVNAVGSTIARETGRGVYQHAGPEIGVASTKAFISQVSILALLTLLLGRSRNLSLVMGRRIGEELKRIPDHIKHILEQSERIKTVARTYEKYENFLYLGRKYNFPVAEEGALKLKEISYVHAEGMSAGEMKHGPLAMIDRSFPSVVIAPKNSVYEKMVSNIQELKARGGPVIAVTTEGNGELEKIADDVLYIPKTLEMLTPLLSVIPLQLFAYHTAVLKGRDVDKPRNLAKSVTVE